jgi:hypothetical protein
MTKTTIAAISLFACSIGCGTDPELQPMPVTRKSVRAPFEYRIIKIDTSPDGLEARVFLLVETPVGAAKHATTEDLRQFWRHIEPTISDESRVLIKLATDVPGTSLWGNITRLNRDGEWEVDVEKFEGEIDEEPYYFVDQIDRTKPKQLMMILTLPVANKIDERLKRSGWNQTYRSENLIKLELPARGMESLNVTLSPEGISVQGYDKDESELFQVIDLLTAEIGIGGAVKRKMQSVIGSPEYFRGNDESHDGYSIWYWTIGDYDVSYRHSEPHWDEVDIAHVQ